MAFNPKFVYVWCRRLKERGTNERETLSSSPSICDPNCPVVSSESFRDRIRVFLRECAEIEDYNIRSMPVWCTLLVQGNKGGLSVPLYTIEETVKHSDQPYCDHCRCCEIEDEAIIIGTRPMQYKREILF